MNKNSIDNKSFYWEFEVGGLLKIEVYIWIDWKNEFLDYLRYIRKFFLKLVNKVINRIKGKKSEI